MLYLVANLGDRGSSLRALAAEFGACVADQAARKPDTAARRLVDGGVQAKLAANPLEHV